MGGGDSEGHGQERGVRVEGGPEAEPVLGVSAGRRIEGGGTTGRFPAQMEGGSGLKAALRLRPRTLTQTIRHT
jgi:hypothetical protein